MTGSGPSGRSSSSLAACGPWSAIWTSTLWVGSRWRCLPRPLQKQVHVVRGDQVGDGPALQVVLGHTLLGEPPAGLGQAAAMGHLPRQAPDGLGRARVVTLVQLVAATELRAQRVP